MIEETKYVSVTMYTTSISCPEIKQIYQDFRLPEEYKAYAKPITDEKQIEEADEWFSQYNTENNQFDIENEIIPSSTEITPIKHESPKRNWWNIFKR